MFFLYVLSKGNVTVSVGILFLGHAFAQIMLREFTMLQQSHSQIDGLSMCPSMFVVCVCVSNLTLLFRNIAVQLMDIVQSCLLHTAIPMGQPE